MTVCDCCGYENIAVKSYTSLRHIDILGGPSQTTMNFCQICASTYLSTIVSFPLNHDSGIIYLAKSIGWIANHINKTPKVETT
jgi:hypothetical protein